MTKIAVSSAIAACIYCAAFWLVEPLRCLIAPGGCQTSGDIRALLIVVPVSILLVAVALAPYMFFVRRSVGNNGASTTMRMGAGSLFLVSAIYGLLVPLVFFIAVGQLASWTDRNGFWLNTGAASVCFAIYILADRKKLLRTAGPGEV